MQIKKLMLGLPVLLWAGLLVTSSPTFSLAAVEPGLPATVNQGGSTAVGKVLGKSAKAGTITLEDKKLGTVMLKFNDATTGLEYAEKGEAAIVMYKVAGPDRIATVIKPKLATLPAGVTEIRPEELATIINAGGDYLLIDSRPGQPYAAGHIPTAISVPVAKMAKEGAAILADNKDKLLIFYCGGPT
jgi:hypothetical protein